MESICVHRSNIGWRTSNTERINPCWETCEQGCHSSEVQNSLPFLTDLLLMRNNPCLIWFTFFCGLLIFSLHFQPFRFCAQGIWLYQQSPWLFADFDEIKEFLWFFTKFPDFLVKVEKNGTWKKKDFVFLTLFNGHFTKFFKSFDLLRATNQWQGVGSDC